MQEMDSGQTLTLAGRVFGLVYTELAGASLLLLWQASPQGGWPLLRGCSEKPEPFHTHPQDSRARAP